MIMKRVSIIVLLLTIGSFLLQAVALQNTVSSSYKKWHLYDSHKGYYNKMLGAPIVINEKQYYKDNGNDNICYRIDETKVYRYNISDGTEVLILDYALQKGDIFKINDTFSMKAEYTTDSIWRYIFNDPIQLKYIRLRCVEYPQYVDEWVESIGSLHYAYDMPDTIPPPNSCNVLACEIGSRSLAFPMAQENASGIGINCDTIDEFIPAFVGNFTPTTEITLQDNTLFINSYVETDGCGYIYIYICSRQRRE